MIFSVFAQQTEDLDDPNRVCDGRDSVLSGNIRNNGFQWFDTACFPVPPTGYFGNSEPQFMVPA